MLVPSLPQVMITFNISGSHEKLASFSVTAYMIGMAVGLAFFGPLSDLYGRAMLSRIAALGFTAATAACAVSRSIEWLIAARVFAGFFGGAPMSIGGALVADLFAPGKRDVAMTCYVAVPVAGPIIGSIIGSLVNSALGWRWIFWIATILVCSCLRYLWNPSSDQPQASLYAILCIIALRETHFPTLERWRRRKIENLQSSRSKDRKRQCLSSGFTEEAKKICKVITVPGKISMYPSISLLIFVLTVYAGFFNILISSLGTVYQRVYNFPPSAAGFGYIAIGVGVIIGLFSAPNLARAIAKKLPESPNGKSHKNYLLVLVIAIVLACMGWICYGWACEKRLHWIVSMIGLVFYGFSGVLIKVSLNFSSDASAVVLSILTIDIIKSLSY